MRDLAIGILLVIVLAIFIQPIVEVSNSGREKIVLDAAITNSSRSAKKNAVTFMFMQELEAIINKQMFVDEFEKAYCATLDLTRVSPAPGAVIPETTNPVILEYSSNTGRYNNIVVSLDFEDGTDYWDFTGTHSASYLHEVTNVTITYETDYVFQNGLMQFMNNADGSSDYTITRTQTINVKMIN